MAAAQERVTGAVVEALYARSTTILTQTIDISEEVRRGAPVPPEKTASLLRQANELIRSIADQISRDPSALSHDVIITMAQVLENVQMCVLSTGTQVRITEITGAQKKSTQADIELLSKQEDPLLAATISGLTLTQLVAAGGTSVEQNRQKLVSTYNAYSHIRDMRNMAHPFGREELEEQSQVLVVMQTALLSTGRSFSLELTGSERKIAQAENVVSNITRYQRSETLFFALPGGSGHAVKLPVLEHARPQEQPDGYIKIAVTTVDNAQVELSFSQEMWKQVSLELNIWKYGKHFTTVTKIEKGSDPDRVRLNDLEFGKKEIIDALNSAQSTNNYYFVEIPHQSGEYKVKLRVYITDAWKIHRIFETGEPMEKQTKKTEKLQQTLSTVIASIDSCANPYQTGSNEGAPAVLEQLALPPGIFDQVLAQTLAANKNLSEPYGILRSRSEHYSVFVSLLNRMIKKVAHDAGIADADFSTPAYMNNLASVVAVAIETAYYTSAFCRRLTRDLSRLSNGDSESAIGMARHLAATAFRVREESLRFEAAKIKSKQKNQISTHSPVEAPKEKSEWLQKGKKWAVLTEGQKRGDPRQPEHSATAGKIALLTELCDRHQDSVQSMFPALLMGQDYFYIRFKPVDAQRRKSFAQRVRFVNDTQDGFAQQVAKNPSEILSAPTGKLKDMFPALEVIGREIKIHLMPKTEDELFVIEQLLEVFSTAEGMAVRDSIDAIKVRLVGNNASDTDRLPEVVIYTQDVAATQVLALIQEKCAHMQGTGRTPRFNKEVANGLIYYAQSGGDLKDQLSELGLLQKFFEKGGDYAEMRV